MRLGMGFMIVIGNFGGILLQPIYFGIFLFFYNLMSANNCQIRNSGAKGVGVYALKPFKKGETVYVCTIEQYDVPNGVYPSQVSMDKWVIFDLIGRSINHSCDPNCGVGYDGANWIFKAFKDIKEDEQLFYDYAMGNYEIDNFPACLCGSPICIRDIKGFRSLPESRKKEYKGNLAPYLEKLIQN